VPELPEVETLCRQLRQVILGRRLLSVEVLDERLGSPPAVAGLAVRQVVRRGKAVALLFHGGVAWKIHLRMTGRLLWETDYGLPVDHLRLICHFDGGRLLLIDPRRFATVDFDDEAGPSGPPDPFAAEDPAGLRREAARRRLPVKAFLLDQRLFPGIGNIYAGEILFAAAVDPRRPARDVTQEEWERIARAARAILREAVRARGTTVSDWRDLFGRPGEYQHRLKVYDRRGGPCPRCGGEIVREKVCGRGSYHCPRCQR